MGSNEGLYMKI